MATKKPTPPAEAEVKETPQPTHGGVYELVGEQLNVIEGGPPKAEPEAPAAGTATPGEGA